MLLLQRVLHRACRRCFTPYYYDIEILAEKAQYDLFRHSCRKGRCLNHPFTVKLRLSGAMRLRTRGHDYKLPTVKYDFNKRNFIVRFLFIMCDFVLFYCRCAVSLFFSARQHPSYGDCLEVKREYYQNCSVLGCVTQCSQSAAHSYEQFSQVQRIGFVTLGPLRHA